MKKFRLLEKTRKTIFYVNKYVVPSIPKIYSVYRNELIKSMFILHRSIISNIKLYLISMYIIKYQEKHKLVILRT